jgi:CCR4-NOT complex subunit CAF16
MAEPAIRVRDLDFGYPGGPPVLRRLALEVPAGARCLLAGANGSGKSTLLAILGGRHMVPDGTVRLLGRPAFADTSLAGRVTRLGGAFPLDVDVGVDEILSHQVGLDGARVARLVEALGVDRRWRMNRVSDGQRRRVQLLLGLARPAEVLLLDEIATDLDVIARAELTAWLREESAARGVTILYATHILDGIEPFATHLAHLAGGRIASLRPLDGKTPLLPLVESLLRARGCP